MKVLGVVTARGGSKGIPGKNVKLLAGKPLIAYSIASARESKAFDRLILTTDDPGIADVARGCGCEVPFMRPAELARDETPHLPVLQHAVDWMRRHERYEPDAVMILQPTSPLRRPEDIRATITMLEQSGADSVVSVSRVPAHLHPLRAVRVDDSGTAVLFATGEPLHKRPNRRQDFPPVSYIDASIYVFRTHVLDSDPPNLYGDRTVAYQTPEPYGLNIDEPEDWAAAERIFAKVQRVHHEPREP